jgi:hypothetical protein
MLLIAVLVSSLLSSAVSSAQEGSATNAVPAASAPLNADNLDQLIQSQEWQDLKVIWNLITGDQGTQTQLFGSEKKNLYSQYNGALCRYVVYLNLRTIKEQGYLSLAETVALESVFSGLLSHFEIKTVSPVFCYMPSNAGTQTMQTKESLDKQMELLRKHGREGTLCAEVVDVAQEALRVKLQFLDLLNTGLYDSFEPAMSRRGHQWKADGKIGPLWMICDGGDEIFDELANEGDFWVNDKQHQRFSVWQKGSSRLARAVVNFARDTETHNLARVSGQITEGNGLRVDEMEPYLRDCGRYYRTELIQVYGHLAGKSATPFLEELLQDDEIQEGWVGGKQTIAYPVRKAALNELVKMAGFGRWQTGIASSLYKKFLLWEHKSCIEVEKFSPDGIAVVRASLTNKNLSVRWVAVCALCKENADTSTIPLLAEIAKNDPELSESVINALCRLGDPGGLPIIFEIAEKGFLNPETICHALAEVGGSDAGSVLLKATAPQYDPFLRFSAAMNLPGAMTTEKVRVAMDLVTSNIPVICKLSFQILSDADDEESFQLLEKLSKDERYSKEAMDALAERRKRAGGEK